MKKEYDLPEENQPQNPLEEPFVDYGTDVQPKENINYDIPEEYLLRRIAQAEKDIEEGRVTPLSEIKKKIIP